MNKRDYINDLTGTQETTVSIKGINASNDFASLALFFCAEEVVVQQYTIMQDLLEARLPVDVILARQPKANRLRPHRQHYHLASHRVYRRHQVRRWGNPRGLQ
jgi:hypothetical protein